MDKCREGIKADAEFSAVFILIVFVYSTMKSDVSTTVPIENWTSTAFDSALDPFLVRIR